MSAKILACVAALALGGLSSLPSRAQESLLELPGRGIAFPKTAEFAPVVVSAMEVRINPSVTRVHYELTNTGSSRIRASLSVPLPTLDFSDPDVAYSIPGEDPINFIGLTARVDRKPVKFAFAQKASLNEKNISATLRQYNLDLIPIGRFQNELAALSKEAHEALAKAGLIVESGTDADGNALYFPSWTVQTTASSTFVFDPAKTVDIDLSYRTSVGSSLDTVLRKGLRSVPSLSAEVQRYSKDYCIDDAFYAGLDKIASRGEANTAKIQERRIEFDLLSSAPATPIGDFRLSVDKERSDRIVSFCLDNLKRINPTTFEMQTSHFIPSANMKILILGRE